MNPVRRELFSRLKDISAARVELTDTILRTSIHNSSTGVTNVVQFISVLNDFLRDTLSQLDFPEPAVERVVSFVSQFEPANVSPPDVFGIIKHGLNWRGQPTSSSLRAFSPR